jgi:hypothetical protein
MTPREQLIEAIADKLATIRVDGTPDENGILRIDADSLAEGVLQSLSDLGAVVLMPVSSSDVHNGERYYTTEKHTVEGYSATEQVGRGGRWPATR